MREIKFRAWNSKTKNYMGLDTFSLEFNDEKSGYDWFLIERAHEYEQEDIVASSANGDILEQYTGLKDKNGVEIYDGDIVKYINLAYDEDFEEQTQEIYLANGTFMQGGLCLSDIDNLEVIGNIHEVKK